MSKDEGLLTKFHVTKLSNPEKKIDAIVLEFDDPISRRTLRTYARILKEQGYEKFSADIISRCNQYEANAVPSEREPWPTRIGEEKGQKEY